MNRTVISLFLLFISLSAKNFEYHLDGLNSYSIPLQNNGVSDTWGYLHGELFPDSSELVNIDSSAYIFFDGSAGAELYDPLLNNYEGTNSVNSDHFTDLNGGIVLPRFNLTLTGNYLYEDRYSQSFDRYRATYFAKHGITLPYGSYGLAEDKAFQARYKNDSTNLTISALSYNRWGIIPSYTDQYSYRMGNAILGRGNITRNGWHFSLSGLGNNYTDVLNTQREIEYTELTASSEVGYSLSKNSIVSVGYERDDRYYTSDRVYSKMNWQWNDHTLDVRIGGYIQGGGEASVESQYQLGSIFFLDASVAYGVRAKEYRRIWESLEGTIHYLENGERTLEESITLHFRKREIVTPVHLFTTVSADHSPEYECADTSGNVIVDSYSDRDILLWGLGGALSFDRPMWGIECEGLLNATMIDTPAFYSPGALRLALLFGADSIRSVKGRIEYELKGSFVKTSLNSYQELVSRYGSVISGVTAEVEIPVKSPILEKRFQPTLLMSAGPIHFSSDQQIAEVPGGNSVGPQIALTIKGKFLISNRDE